MDWFSVIHLAYLPVNVPGVFNCSREIISNEFIDKF